MIVDTRRLFARLLPALGIDTVCDVGSMDGTDALRFRAAVPAAAIHAFEAHPHNALAMRSNPELRRAGIAVVPTAIAERDGHAQLFATTQAHSHGDAWRGMSSLHRRTVKPELLTPVTVPTVRLDTYLRDRLPAAARLALWIDAEGKAFEVIDGASGVLGRTHVVHVEVETAPCIGAEQKYYRDVVRLLEGAGFRELAADGPRARAQFNALFVRADLPPARRWCVAWRLAVARLRQLAIATLRALCPECLRRYRAAHSRSRLPTRSP
jgi:FkbM family methyltransferase